MEQMQTKETLAAIAEARAARPERVTIPLPQAVLCLGCDVLYQGPACPKCGDRFGWLVGRWLSARAA